MTNISWNTILLLFENCFYLSQGLKFSEIAYYLILLHLYQIEFQLALPHHDFSVWFLQDGEKESLVCCKFDFFMKFYTKVDDVSYNFGYVLLLCVCYTYSSLHRELASSSAMMPDGIFLTPLGTLEA